MPPPREVQPLTRLHISTPGIGVDGERGYNSSHCIGSSRVIGPSPGFLPLPLPRDPPSSTPSCSPSYRISFSEGPARACIVPLAMPKSRYLSPLRPTASPLPFCALSAALWFKCTADPTDARMHSSRMDDSYHASSVLRNKRP